jgi:hypothetical protein
MAAKSVSRVFERMGVVNVVRGDSPTQDNTMVVNVSEGISDVRLSMSVNAVARLTPDEADHLADALFKMAERVRKAQS